MDSLILKNELNKKQNELEEEKNKYKTIMENSSDSIFIVNLDGFIVDCSNQFLKELGYIKEEIYTLHISDYEAIHSKELIKENIEKTAFEPINFESIYKRKDGSLINVSINVIRIKIENEEYLYSSFRNITERKRLEQELINQKNEFEMIFNYSQDGIAIVDLDMIFLNFNNSFLKITGYSKEDLLSKSCDDLTDIEHRPLNKEMIENAIKNGHTENFEKVCIFKNNIRKTLNVSISLLPDKKRLLLTIKDVTSIKNMEQNAKLASMGEMIGNIAHQWRQPLSLITTSVSGLKLKLEFNNNLEKEDIFDCVDIVQKQAKYLSETIDNFRNFIKGDNLIESLKLTDIIEESLSLVNASFRNNFIETITDLDNKITININKNELIEAFVNILNNSKDALKINISNKSKKYVFIKTQFLDTNKVEILFYDNAGGIPEEIINKVFEPYFTTKLQSQGTGLGLSISDKIIRERMKSEISVYNKEFLYQNNKYKGACFKICLKTQS